MGGQKKQSKNKNTNSNKQNSRNDSKQATLTVNPNEVKKSQNLPLLKKDILSTEKRSELEGYVATLMDLGFKSPSTVNEQWDLYKKLQNTLQNIIRIEQPLIKKYELLTPIKRLAKIDEFYAWAKENELKYDGIEIAEFDGFELGLRATRDIMKEESLFTIPHKLILSEENLADGMDWKFGNMSNLNLVYTLMLEAINPNSFWKPYIELLPKEYNTCLYFKNDEIEMLKGSNILPAVLRQCKSIALQYAIIYNFMFQIKNVNSVKPLGILLKQRYCYNLYRWAVSTVMTRENVIPRLTPTTTAANNTDSASSETMAVLIPFWDMANHKNGYITSYYNAETKQMESTSQEFFKKDEQIFIHYGDRSNADFMLHNGFINAENPKDSVSIKLGLNNSDALFKERSKLLDLLQIPINAELKVLPAPVYISSELLAYVRVFNMNAEQLDHWITSERAGDLLHIDCALETCLETKTWKYIQTRLMLLLRCFPTTLELDEIQLNKFKSGEHELSNIGSMLLEYRVLEKRILTAALDYAEQRTKA